MARNCLRGGLFADLLSQPSLQIALLQAALLQAAVVCRGIFEGSFLGYRAPLKGARGGYKAGLELSLRRTIWLFLLIGAGGGLLGSTG